VTDVKIRVRKNNNALENRASLISYVNKSITDAINLTTALPNRLVNSKYKLDYIQFSMNKEVKAGANCLRLKLN